MPLHADISLPISLQWPAGLSKHSTLATHTTAHDWCCCMTVCLHMLMPPSPFPCSGLTTLLKYGVLLDTGVSLLIPLHWPGCLFKYSYLSYSYDSTGLVLLHDCVRPHADASLPLPMQWLYYPLTDSVHLHARVSLPIPCSACSNTATFATHTTAQDWRCCMTVFVHMLTPTSPSPCSGAGTGPFATTAASLTGTTPTWRSTATAWSPSSTSSSSAHTTGGAQALYPLGTCAQGRQFHPPSLPTHIAAAPTILRVNKLCRHMTSHPVQKCQVGHQCMKKGPLGQFIMPRLGRRSFADTHSSTCVPHIGA